MYELYAPINSMMTNFQKQNIKEIYCGKIIVFYGKQNNS